MAISTGVSSATDIPRLKSTIGGRSSVTSEPAVIRIGLEAEISSAPSPATNALAVTVTGSVVRSGSFSRSPRKLNLVVSLIRCAGTSPGWKLRSAVWIWVAENPPRASIDSVRIHPNGAPQMETTARRSPSAMQTRRTVRVRPSRRFDRRAATTTANQPKARAFAKTATESVCRPRSRRVTARDARARSTSSGRTHQAKSWNTPRLMSGLEAKDGVVGEQDG
jgi:hypothetical protein